MNYFIQNYALGTAVIRLTFLYFPIRVQQLTAVQRKFAPDLTRFRERIKEANNEDNQMLGKFCRKLFFK